MKLSIGFSPCPNDTFMLDAMINGKIDTEGIQFEPLIADVEKLNTLAFNQECVITKMSYHAFAHLTDKYSMLHAGSALGDNCGPILISKDQIDENSPSEHHSVAIPGKYTTAAFLLKFACPQLSDLREMIFSEIENAVLKDETDLGLIIHENRFTYQEKGLKKVIDLGEYWTEKTGFPIPLGGIAVKKTMSSEIQKKVNRVMKRSIEFAFANPLSSREYVKEHSQELDDKVIQSHINLYVNKYSLELGKKGREAILFLIENVRSDNFNSEKVFADSDENVIV